MHLPHDVGEWGRYGQLWLDVGSTAPGALAFYPHLHVFSLTQIQVEREDRG